MACRAKTRLPSEDGRAGCLGQGRRSRLPSEYVASVPVFRRGSRPPSAVNRQRSRSVPETSTSGLPRWRSPETASSVEAGGVVGADTERALTRGRSRHGTSQAITTARGGARIGPRRGAARLSAGRSLGTSRTTSHVSDGRRSPFLRAVGTRAARASGTGCVARAGRVLVVPLGRGCPEAWAGTAHIWRRWVTDVLRSLRVNDRVPPGGHSRPRSWAGTADVCRPWVTAVREARRERRTCGAAGHG